MVLALALLFAVLMSVGIRSTRNGSWQRVLACLGALCVLYIPAAGLAGDDDFFYASLLLSMVGGLVSLKCLADRSPWSLPLSLPLVVPWGLLAWVFTHAD